MRNSSIADALFPRTRQRVLATLLLNPQKPCYAAELAKYLGLRQSTLQRDLARLSAAGILKMSRNGNRVYFRADETCPIFPELRSLLVKTAGLVEVLREQLAPFGTRINLAAVYGSMASGNEASGSDIDLLIIGSISLMDLVPLLERATEQFRRQVNPTIYTPEELSRKARESRFVRSVLGKPLLFVVGNKRDLEAITRR
jgi:DNA-binding transcriptional ArsR family regulator